MERTPALSSTDLRDGMYSGRAADRDDMIRAMRLQIWSGAILGGLVAAMVGAIFLFVVSRLLLAPCSLQFADVSVLPLHT